MIWLLACAEGTGLPQGGPDATGLVLLIHGSGDSVEDWPAELAPVIEDQVDATWDVLSYDWFEDAQDKLWAASRAEDHGADLALELADRDYERVHVIAHSVGAHVGQALVEDTELPVQLTLLDPFGGRGLVRWGYGDRHFGEGASFAETVFNADDGVPSTESAPPATHGFDVTDAKGDWEGDAHWWPVDWYASSLGTGVGLDLSIALGGETLWPDFPPGEVTQLP